MEAKDDIAFRQLDRIVVQGRTQPVKMYEVIGMTEELSSETAACIGCFIDGMEKYLDQDWDRARALFEEAAKLEPFQPGGELGIITNPSLVMLDRVPQMKANPPGDGWDGVYVMQTK